MDDRILLISIRPPVDSCTARRLASDNNLLCISAKCCNVLLEPFHRQTLVTQSKVSICVRCSRETENVQSIVDGDNNDILVVSEVLAICEWCVGVTASKTCRMSK